MLDRLSTPLRPPQLVVAALAGGAESPIQAASWALANVLPWLAGFEFGKRARTDGGKAASLGSALLLSLALDLGLSGQRFEWPFELVRRMPGLLLTAFLVGVATRRERRAAVAAEFAPLPVAPAQLDWVGAAGNYVELHGGGRILLHRAPLSRVEAELSRHGFVRVHRSILVRRDRIARIRPLDVILHDGTSLRTGSRYRAALRG